MECCTDADVERGGEEGDVMARRLGKPPATLYFVSYDCGHWDARWHFVSTKRRCRYCCQFTRAEPGNPVRVVRYKPTAPRRAETEGAK